jgi:hypothetical protein
MVDEMATQVRLGKGSVEKERIDNINTEFEKFWELYNKKI